MNIRILSLHDGYVYLEKDYNNRSVNIYCLKKCVLTGVNICYPNSLLFSVDKRGLYLPINEQTMSLKSKTIYHESGMKYNANINIKGIFNQPVFFFIYNVENYFHFLYDTIPILLSYFHLKQTVPDLKILINYPSGKNTFYKFVLESLELLGVLDDIIIAKRDVLYGTVYISDSYTHNGMSNSAPRLEIYHLYKKMTEKALSLNKNMITYDNIYISRRTWMHNDHSNIGTNYTTRRRLLNEDRLVERLVEKDFKEIFTEKLSMSEKIVLFNKAKTVIGAIGGGISNVLFSKPSTRLFAIISPTFLDVNMRFRYCLNGVDVQYFKDTYHSESDSFKTYMRVKTNGGIIGEIENINKDMLTISYCSSGSNVGWSSDVEYEKTYIHKDSVERLDNGLNSPWYVNIDKLLYSIKS